MSWFAERFSRGRLDRDLSEEMRAHLDEKAAALEAGGMPAEEARREARLQFGSPLRWREESRDAWGSRWLDALFQDLRFAARTLRKSPGFTAIVIATLAIGIGANTAIFSVVYAVLLKPLPYANPDRLASVFQANPQQKIPADAFSYASFTECRDHNGVFSRMAAYNAHDLVLTGAGEPAEVHTVVVTPETFALLGVKPLIGRALVPQDGARGAAAVVVLSENLWRSRFGANRAIVGRSISLDKRAFTVVGVMPASFRFPLDAKSGDIWIPVIQDPVFGPLLSAGAAARFLITVARLKPAVSMKQAQADMDATAARLAKEFPAANSGWTIRVEPLQQEITGNTRSALLVLLGAVLLVLLIACANIANLLLARATSRAREIGVRIALGAGRARIARQLLTESALLGLLGGVAGIAVAYWGVSALGDMLPADLPRVQALHVDGWVLLFAIVLSGVATVIFGLAPALFAADSSLPASLKESAGRSGEAGRRRRARSLLAAAEIALAMVLLVAAGLLIRSFAALTSVYPGFNAQHVVTAEIDLPRYQYSKPEQWVAFGNELLTKIQAQPGLRDSAIGAPLPIADGFAGISFVIVGNPPLPPGTLQQVHYAMVSPRYFHVMDVPLLRGRFFSEHDSSMAPRVAIISEAFARRYFPDQDPLGRQLSFGFLSKSVPWEIVGVAGDVRDVALSKQPDPILYAPFDQSPLWGAVLAVRTSLGAPSAAAAIRHATHQIDRNLPVTKVETLPDAISASVAQPRFRTLLLGLFGAIALALAVVGIFGVMSYSVARRTREIGLRMALGATPGGVLRMILGDSLKLVVVGLTAGIAAAFALTRLLSSMLFAVRPSDPLTFIAVAAALTVVALLACSIPARRASRVDPAVALREE